MNQHTCILCLGSNFYRIAHMAYAQRDLKKHFPTIRFSEEMETEELVSVTSESEAEEVTQTDCHVRIT